MVLDASKTNPLDRCKQKQISQFIAHETNYSQYIANENGFGFIQNQSLDRWKQISQFMADENGFGCIQNQFVD